MDFKAETRQLTTPAKELLASGMIPAELYGNGIENLHLSLPAKEFRRTLKAAGETTIVQVEVGGKKYPVLIHEVAIDPLTSEIRHVDLYHIKTGQKIRTNVPIEFIGESEGVKTGGVVNKALAEIEVEAPAEKLPHSFTVDLTALVTVGDSIMAKDLKVGSEVKLFVDPETVIASLAAQKEEVEAPAEIDLSAIKSEAEIKKEEREAKKTQEEES